MKKFLLLPKSTEKKTDGSPTTPRMSLLLPERNFRPIIFMYLSRESDMPSNFFKKGETVYKRSVFARSDGDIVKPLMETVASGRLYVFQDSAPAHTS